FLYLAGVQCLARAGADCGRAVDRPSGLALGVLDAGRIGRAGGLLVCAAPARDLADVQTSVFGLVAVAGRAMAFVAQYPFYGDEPGFQLVDRCAGIFDWCRAWFHYPYLEAARDRVCGLVRALGDWGQRGSLGLSSALPSLGSAQAD